MVPALQEIKEAPGSAQAPALVLHDLQELMQPPSPEAPPGGAQPEGEAASKA